MLFNSWQFALFFPIVTSLYFLLTHRQRIYMLLLASCVFYMAFVPIYLGILIFTILIDYFAALRMDQAEDRRRKYWLIASVIANVSVLAFFKYVDFVIVNVNALTQWIGSPQSIPLLSILLPIGLSFHTFQAMSYTIEVYRKHQKPERDLITYALYVMFYPQLVAGPIERPQNLLPQFHRDLKFDYDKVISGLRRMVWGFFKKVFIADRLAVLVTAIYDQPQDQSGLLLLLATYAFAFQIYCDFSGYSDIAIGCARVMGIDLMRNFDRPYAALSLSEFWKRWHISLSTWFRDYLYIPLGGNRVSQLRNAFNLLIVFLVSGLWHGANWTYVIWGGIHGSVLVIEKKLFSKVPKPIRWFVTFHIVVLAWIFFRARSVHDAGLILSKIFTFSGETSWQKLPLGVFELFLAGFGILLMELGQWLNAHRRIELKFNHAPSWVRWGVYYSGGLLVLFLGKFSQTQFIYFQF